MSDLDEPTPTVPAIDVRGVSKSYPARGLPWGKNGASNDALRDISFSVADGETVGLLGPNGAGKTTLLKIIATLLHPSSGQVLIHGHDQLEHPLETRGSMGLITCDERSFYWRLSGQRNLEFFAALYRVPRTVAHARIEELLETLGLDEARHRPFHSYSSGMKQKLAIARGLLKNPRIALYDEPTRSLDPVSAMNIRKWIVKNRDARPDTAHLIATNQLEEAEQLCDRVLIIDHGTRIAYGSIQEMTETFRREQQAVHLITCSGFELDGQLGPQPDVGLISIEQTRSNGDVTELKLRASSSGDALSLVVGTILRSGGKLIRCETEQASFSQVFHSLLDGDDT